VLSETSSKEGIAKKEIRKEDGEGKEQGEG